MTAGVRIFTDARHFVPGMVSLAGTGLAAIFFACVRVRDRRHMYREQGLKNAVRQRTEELEIERTREKERNRILSFWCPTSSSGRFWTGWLNSWKMRRGNPGASSCSGSPVFGITGRLPHALRGQPSRRVERCAGITPFRAVRGMETALRIPRAGARSRMGDLHKWSAGAPAGRHPHAPDRQRRSCPRRGPALRQAPHAGCPGSEFGPRHIMRGKGYRGSP